MSPLLSNLSHNVPTSAILQHRVPIKGITASTTNNLPSVVLVVGQTALSSVRHVLAGLGHLVESVPSGAREARKDVLPGASNIMSGQHAVLNRTVVDIGVEAFGVVFVGIEAVVAENTQFLVNCGRSGAVSPPEAALGWDGVLEAGSLLLDVVLLADHASLSPSDDSSTDEAWLCGWELDGAAGW